MVRPPALEKRTSRCRLQARPRYPPDRANRAPSTDTPGGMRQKLRPPPRLRIDPGPWPATARNRDDCTSRNRPGTCEPNDSAGMLRPSWTREGCASSPDGQPKAGHPRFARGCGVLRTPCSKKPSQHHSRPTTTRPLSHFGAAQYTPPGGGGPPLGHPPVPPPLPLPLPLPLPQRPVGGGRARPTRYLRARVRERGGRST